MSNSKSTMNNKEDLSQLSSSASSSQPETSSNSSLSSKGARRVKVRSETNEPIVYCDKLESSSQRNSQRKSSTLQASAPNIQKNDARKDSKSGEKSQRVVTNTLSAPPNSPSSTSSSTRPELNGCSPQSPSGTKRSREESLEEETNKKAHHVSVLVRGNKADATGPRPIKAPTKENPELQSVLKTKSSYPRSSQNSAQPTKRKSAEHAEQEDPMSNQPTGKKIRFASENQIHVFDVFHNENTVSDLMIEASQEEESSEVQIATLTPSGLNNKPSPNGEYSCLC